MATYDTLTSLLTAIANSIRTKTGETGQINAQNFPSKILSILQGSGNAHPHDVLTGKTFTNDSGEQTGTMANNGAVSQSLSFGGSYTIPVGYHNGSGKVTAQSPSGSTSITSNGSHDVTNYATATVNVPLGYDWKQFNYSVNLNTGGSSYSTTYKINYTSNDGTSTSTTVNLGDVQGGYYLNNSNIYIEGDNSRINFGYYVTNPNDNKNLRVITNSYSFNISSQTVNLTGYKLA